MSSSASSTADACCHPSQTHPVAIRPIPAARIISAEPSAVIPAQSGNHVDLDYAFPLPTPFQFDHVTLDQPVTIKARLVGPALAPVVLVLGGISANRHVCDGANIPVFVPARPDAGKAVSGNAYHTPTSGWWREVTGPNLPLDTERYRILSFDFLPENDILEPLPVTPTDQARVARVVCDYFGIEKLHAFVGASYGGMVALSFAELFPERVEHLIIACAGHRPHPMGAAWRSIQRKIVQLGLATDQPDQALSLARELGMTTYRTIQEFGERFATGAEAADYLESRGRDFIHKMSPHRYLSLSESIDRHQVEPAAIRVPVSLIAFRQDQLVPIEEVQYLRDQLPTVQHYFEWDSIFGHDAFLKETELVSSAIRQCLS